MNTANESVDIYQIENILREQGLEYICGIDEAGRGPLCGDVVAAAVILPKGLAIEGLNDSKKLTEKKRDALYDIIIEKAVAYGVGMASPQEIDEINILQATFLAMKRAVDALAIKPEFALVDGNRDPKLLITTETVVKGDSKVAAIAAASIIAKVTRDRQLLALDEAYPQYGFAAHKGYPTKAHYQAIKEFGVLDIYRKSFLKNLAEK